MIKLQQHARWLPADTETPISLYLEMAGEKEGILLESAEVDGRWGRYSILACDMAFFISCHEGKLALDIRDGRFKPLRRHEGEAFIEGLRGLMADLAINPAANMRDLPPITRALYGFLGFGMAGIFNPVLAPALPPEEAECCLAFPRTTLVFDHLYNRLCQLGLDGDFPDLPRSPARRPEENINLGECAASAEPGGDGYKAFVEDIRERLRNGEAIQVVPSCRFSIPFAADPFTLYRRMRRRNASPYMFYMRFPQITLFGSSPELMARCEKGRLRLSPIAGTRRRGASDAEDAALAKELLEDPKERAEHVMLVDLGRNDLGRIARPGTVRLERFMEIERFSHVMHITSGITAMLGKDDGGNSLDALDVLAATFPAGTVSGAPKLRAMEIIAELEKTPRGPYAGCIGWIGLDRDAVNLDMGITIRSMWVKDGKLHWQAGGGITHDSDPDMEWSEVCAKAAIMRQALSPEDKEYVPVNR